MNFNPINKEIVKKKKSLFQEERESTFYYKWNV